MTLIDGRTFESITQRRNYVGDELIDTLLKFTPAAGSEPRDVELILGIQGEPHVVGLSAREIALVREILQIAPVRHSLGQDPRVENDRRAVIAFHLRARVGIVVDLDLIEPDDHAGSCVDKRQYEVTRRHFVGHIPKVTAPVPGVHVL
ncbi:hypothetical protein ACFULT_22100 [Rhodococcus sp. NPDC057297]|uniref:hypothetical protein n=1 Tax=Rhodococcus sp. NPDC057297 TaxID=3346090 RepID=UPI003644E43B